MSEDEKEQAKIIIPSFMRASCWLDDAVNRGEHSSGNTFTMTEIHNAAVLRSFTPDVVAWTIRGYSMEQESVIEFDNDDKVTLINKGTQLVLRRTRMILVSSTKSSERRTTLYAVWTSPNSLFDTLGIEYNYQQQKIWFLFCIDFQKWSISDILTLKV
jgi:hypothetical protein